MECFLKLGLSLPKNLKIASIGPITSETAAKLGFEVHITAQQYTIPGLCDAIVKYAALQAPPQ